MKNMGLSRLKLVQPPKLDDECFKMAVGARDVVEESITYTSLNLALADEQVIVGTTSTRGRAQHQIPQSPREAAPLLRSKAQKNRVALVFGPERSGLDDDTLSRCQHLVTIPTSSESPVLNLAQSVMVLAYEILIAGEPKASAPASIVTDESRAQMFHHVETTLETIGFFQGENRAHMMKAIRRLFGKSDLTRRDIRIVRGIMSQIEWYVAQARRGER